MHVVVLGAGYAGLTLARELTDRLPDDEVRVVDETGTHLVQHELHRLIRRPGLADELELPLSELLEDAAITRERVASVDADARSIHLESGDRMEYDVAAICLGAEADFGDIDGLAEHATPLKGVEDARRIREDVEPVLSEGGRIVVGGAGLSGIQVAGELAEMRAAEDSDVEIALLEQADAVAPGFDGNFQSAVRTQLERRSVAVRTGATIEGADADGVVLADGESLSYDALIWTGGIRGDDAMDGQRPTVRSDLRLAERTFVLGDAARVVDDHGEAVPASARTAIGQAAVVADNVVATLEHAREGATGEFTPRLSRYTAGQPRWLVSVGDGAVAQVGNAVLTGRPALALKTSAGAGYVGRIAPIRNAVDLVWSELGLADDDRPPVDLPEGASQAGDADQHSGDDAAARDDETASNEDEEFERLPDGVVEELREE